MTFAALAGGLGLAAIAVLTVATVCSGAEIPDVLRAIHQVEASGRLHLGRGRAAVLNAAAAKEK